MTDNDWISWCFCFLYMPFGYFVPKHKGTQARAIPKTPIPHHFQGWFTDPAEEHHCFEQSTRLVKLPLGACDWNSIARVFPLLHCGTQDLSVIGLWTVSFWLKMMCGWNYAYVFRCIQGKAGDKVEAPGWLEQQGTYSNQSEISSTHKSERLRN